MSNKRWQIRRRLVNITLLFCAVVVGYLVLYGKDTNLHNSIANGLILFAGSVVSSYIFGATWDDKGRKNHHRREEDDV